LIRRERFKSKSLFLDSKVQHVVITGGSSGIGLCIAKECCRLTKKDGSPMFSHVSLIARNMSKLQVAKEEVEKTSSNNKVVVTIVSADVSNYEELSETLKTTILTSNIPTPTLLFNVAGTSIPCRFLESDPSIYSELMSINYLGSVYTTRAVAPLMVENGGGTIVLTSSVAGQVGTYGYTAYSPTKFALRGFAEALMMELAPFNVHVQLSFPPNTDTPGFEKENILKMEECRLIEDEAGLFQPEEIAQKMVKEALSNNTRYLVWFGLEGWMMSTLTCGMSGVHNFVDALCQILLLSLFRFVSLFYLKKFRSLVESCHSKRTNQKG